MNEFKTQFADRMFGECAKYSSYGAQSNNARAQRANLLVSNLSGQTRLLPLLGRSCGGLSLGEVAHVNHQVPDIVILGAPRILTRHLVFAIAQEGKEVRV